MAVFSVCIGSHLNTDHERSAKTKAQTKFQAQLVGWLEQQVSGWMGGFHDEYSYCLYDDPPGTSGDYEVDRHVASLEGDSG